MHRDGELIMFNRADRKICALPEQLPVTDAVETAVELQASAQRLQNKANAAIDSSNKDAVRAGRETRNRADQLGTFASRVLELCPYEHLEFLSDQGS